MQGSWVNWQVCMDYLIRTMEKRHIPEVVAVHLDSFQGFFLSILGPAFLRELYLSLLGAEDGICLAAITEERVLGFVAGTSRSSGVYSRLLRQRFVRFCLAAVPAVLKNPGMVPRLINRLRDSQGERSSAPGRGTLMSIAVLPEQQGKGIGQALVQGFLKQAALAGCKEVDLTTDQEENESVNHFYRKQGFRLEKTFTTLEERVMNLYLIELE